MSRVVREEREGEECVSGSGGCEGPCALKRTRTRRKVRKKLGYRMDDSGLPWRISLVLTAAPHLGKPYVLGPRLTGACTLLLSTAAIQAETDWVAEQRA